MPFAFKNREDAGKKLSQLLAAYAQRPNFMVIGLARGGVKVAAQVSLRLRLPLRIMVARKIRLPAFPESALGAVAEGMGFYFSKDQASAMMGPSTIEKKRFKQELVKLKLQADEELKYLCGQLHPNHRQPESYPAHYLNVQDQSVILVDDGLATGSTAIAAARGLKNLGAKKIILAVPVASSQSVALLPSEVDEVVSFIKVDDLDCVSRWYQDFPQIESKEVQEIERRINLEN